MLKQLHIQNYAIIDSIVAKKETEKGNAKEPVSEVNFLVIEINRLTRTLPNEIKVATHMNAPKYAFAANFL